MTNDKHIDETRLELYILNSPTLTDERAEIEAHLAECKGCKELYDNVAEFYTVLKADIDASENLPAVIPRELPARVQQHDLQKRLSDYIMRHDVKLAFPFRAARWVIRHPYFSGGASLMFSSFVIAALITMFKPTETKPRDMNPTLAEFKGEMMIVENKYEEEIDEIKLGSAITQRYIADDKHLTYCFYDVDGDGTNEVIWAHGAENKNTNNPREASILSCKSIRRGQILWSDTLGVPLNYPLKNESYSKTFVAMMVKAGDLDKDGEPEIYVLTNHNGMFPGLLQKLDARDGSREGLYIHSGQFDNVKFADINNDGITDIVLVGLNNGLKNACLIILDPRYISGYSPSPMEYHPSGYNPATEIAYIRIPKTIVGKNLPNVREWNTACYLDIYENTKTLRVDVGDGSTGSASENPGLTFIFGFDLTIKEIQPGDNYDVVAKKLYQAGKIRQYPGPQYLEAFKKECMYWDGTNWQNYPVQNKFYLEATKKLQTPS